MKGTVYTVLYYKTNKNDERSLLNVNLGNIGQMEALKKLVINIPMETGLMVRYE